MAAVIKCDGCGNCVKHTEAMHIRTYKMDSPTTYRTADVKDVADVCSECYKKVRVLIGKGAKK